MLEIENSEPLGALSVAVGDRLEKELEEAIPTRPFAAAALNSGGYLQKAHERRARRSLGPRTQKPSARSDKYRKQDLIERRVSEKRDMRCGLALFYKKGRASLSAFSQSDCATLCEVIPGLRSRVRGRRLDNCWRSS